MHQLERETYDDAFLNEAMEGYEELSGDDHEETLAELKNQLRNRAAKEKKGRLVMWRLLPIAASVVLLVAAGYWFFKPKEVKQMYAQVIEKPEIIGADSINKVDSKEGNLTKIEQNSDEPIRPRPAPPTPLQMAPPIRNSDLPTKITYKTDTVEYIASDYKVRSNANVDEILKKVAGGFEIDTTGDVTFNGQPITKARLNGKDYSGGDASQAIKSLPADIIEKFQIVDDYGDQAGRTGIKSLGPDKVLVFTTRGHDKDTVYYRTVEVLMDTTGLPTPRIGWIEYMSYITTKALNSEGLTGEAEVSFFVGLNGQISRLRIIKGSNNLINKRSSAIILNGPKWQGGLRGKQIRLKIFFYKK